MLHYPFSKEVTSIIDGLTGIYNREMLITYPCTCAGSAGLRFPGTRINNVRTQRNHAKTLRILLKKRRHPLWDKELVEVILLGWKK